MITRVSLIGFRGCGKSTVGRLVATRLGWSFADADSLLEKRLACSIPVFWSAHGEAAFRDREAACLSEALAEGPPQVLATGGGVVVREENRRQLRRQGGLVVYLEADAATLAERLIRDPGGRPSLTGQPLSEEVPAQLAVRHPLYRECATLTLSATTSPETLAAAIASAVLRADPTRSRTVTP